MLGTQLQLTTPHVRFGTCFTCIVSDATTQIALDNCGYAWSVGYNNCGQLGDGSTTSRCCWVKVCCNYTYCSLSIGDSTVFGILTNGRAVAWGNGLGGSLGDGTTAPKCQPVAVCCNYTYTRIASSNGNNSIGILTNGCAVAWGCNVCGQLGDGTIVSKCQPIAVCCNYTYCDIDTNCNSVLGIRTTGCLVSWGANTCGILGDGSVTTAPKCQPVAVCCNYTYTRIKSGGNTSHGIRTDGTLVAWGAGACGALGDGTIVSKCQPVAVCCNYTYCDISSDLCYAVGVRTTGAAVAWGSGLCGSLGDGSITAKCQPVAVCCNCNIKQISIAGRYVSAIKCDNTGLQWGSGTNGISANGSGTFLFCVPQTLPSLLG